MSIQQTVSIPTPAGMFDTDADIVQNPSLLKEVLSQLFKNVRPKPASVHLSLPGTLLRMVEMPKMDPSGLYVSLSSEAERYKMFDNTDAIVDFVIQDNPNLPPNQQQLVFGAVRSDTLGYYLKTLKELRIKTASISLEPLNTLRAMAGTGVLDSLVQQIGQDAYWGVLFVEPTRIRISLWQCDRLIELRETAMDTHEFSTATNDSIVVEDILEEIRRTTKNSQPTLWFTHGMPAVMERILASRLGCSIQAAPLGSGIQINDPLQASTIGCAIASSVMFPFDLDITAGLGPSGSTGMTSAAVEASDMSAGEGGSWMIPVGVASVLLGGLISGGLFMGATIVGQNIPGLVSKRDSAQMEVTALETRYNQLQKDVSLDTTLIDLIRKAKIRNHVYVTLSNDLREKTPERVWFHTLKVGDTFEILGKAMSQESVFRFARSFDPVPYTQAVQIQAIKEERLNGMRVFDFKIGGNILLDPALFEGQDTTPSSIGKLAAPSANNASSPQSGV